MNPSRSFKDVIAWQKAHQLVLRSYKLSETFPKSEVFGLTAQLRSAAVSVAANIAEGFRRTGLKDKNRFFNISQASLDECIYYYILAQDLEYADTTSIQLQADEVGRVLDAYIKAINKKYLGNNKREASNE